MSGDTQPRKRKAKGKRKDEAEHDNGVIIKGSQKGGIESEGSGSAAKLVFVVLLLALSIVIGLLIVELRAGIPVERESIRFGEKRAAPPVVVEEHVEVIQPSVEEIPEAEELLEPEPEISVEETEPEISVEPEPEIPVGHQETPPLDSVVEVVEVVEVPEESTPVEAEPQIVEVVEEVVVVEVPEEAEPQVVEVPVEEEPHVVEVVEEVTVYETPEELEPQVEVVEEVIEEPQVIKEVFEEPEVVEEVVEIVEIEESELVEVEEPAAEEVVEEPEAVEEVVEEPEAVEEVEEPAAVEEVEELPTVEEDAEEVEAVEEVVEELLAAEEIVEEPQAVEEVAEEPEILEEPEVDAAPSEAVPEPEVAEIVEEVIVEAPADSDEVVSEVLIDEPIVLQEEVAIEAHEEPHSVEVVEEVAVEPEELPEPAAQVVEVDEEVVVDAPAAVEVEEPVEVETASEPVVEIEEIEAVEETASEASAPESDEENDLVLDIHDAYVRTEALADEVLRLDPDNQMVNQLAPHMSQVLEAMESRELDGLMDTLNHIQQILEDVRNRIEEGTAVPAGETQDDTQEALAPPVADAEESIEAPAPAAAAVEELAVVEESVVGSVEGAVEEVSQEIDAVDVEVAQEKQAEELDAPVAEAAQEVPVVEAAQEVPVVEAAQEVPVVEAAQDDPVAEAAQDIPAVEEETAPEEAPVAELVSETEPAVVDEPASTVEEPVEVVDEVSVKEAPIVEAPLPVAETETKATPTPIDEDRLREIEEQIIVDTKEGETTNIGGGNEPPSSSGHEDSPTSDPAPSPTSGDSRVPVDEVIPDPVYITPLQELEEAEEAPAQDAPAPAPAASPTPAEPEVYEKADITSPVDDKIRDSLDNADKVLEQDPHLALNMFGAVLHFHPKSARATYGRAQCLDRLAELESSNSKLEQAIMTYRQVVDLADEDPNLVPLPLVRLAAEKCIDRMRFRGFLGKAVRVQQRLLQRFPDDLGLRNQLGVTFLLMNQAPAAKEVFQEVLQKWPDDGFAQVHYGFVLKTTYNNNSGGAEFLRRGIESGIEGTQDGRFYFHLGDALQRQGLEDEAYQVYDNGVEKGLFLNRFQRSLYNVNRLTSRPVWTQEQTTYQEFFRKLEENWEVIRDEGVALLSEPLQDGYRAEAENLRDTGDWKQYELYSRGRKITANCVKAPKTCELVKYAAATSCKRGQIKFSVMMPGTHVWPHTGPTNCRLRAHLGLVVPTGLRLRVGQEQIRWQQGKVVVFDDSWEHEVWHEGTSPRLILIVDVWHPDLTEEEWKTLTPI